MESPAVANIGPVSHCPVDADGVPAEWVEAVVATPGQPTIISLAGSATLEAARPLARRLAVRTGARVLSVPCATVSDGVIAYAWLLGEGVDLDTTTFHAASPDDDLQGAIRRHAQRLGLPLPAQRSDPAAATG